MKTACTAILISVGAIQVLQLEVGGPYVRVYPVGTLNSIVVPPYNGTRGNQIGWCDGADYYNISFSVAVRNGVIAMKTLIHGLAVTFIKCQQCLNQCRWSRQQ